MDEKKVTVSANECQFGSLKGIAEGNAETPPASISRHVKLAIRRHISPSQDRLLHQKVDAAIDKISELKGEKDASEKLVSNVKREPLKAGEMVRVKSIEEIEATLNNLGATKGCTFMADIMTPYCGTVQRVLKPMERFVDERDLRVKKCKGIVLLDGVMCEGTTAFGRCDRSCHMFWREDWLEKIDAE